ncbi:MAG: hypothetical protein ACXWG9_03480 [Usitatibacter sp.]
MNSGRDRMPVCWPSPWSSDIAASVWSCALPTTTRKLLLISLTALSVSSITSSTESVTSCSFLRFACEAVSQRSSIVSSPTTTCWNRRVRLRHLRNGSSPPMPMGSSSAFRSFIASARATSAARGTRHSEVTSAQCGTRNIIHSQGRNSTTMRAARR